MQSRFQLRKGNACSFKTLCNLHRHQECHAEDDGNKFRCQTCGRLYTSNSTLRAHSITHSNVRPHKCPHCVKTFKRNQDLKVRRLRGVSIRFFLPFSFILTSTPGPGRIGVRIVRRPSRLRGTASPTGRGCTPSRWSETGNAPP